MNVFFLCKIVGLGEAPTGQDVNDILGSHAGRIVSYITHMEANRVSLQWHVGAPRNFPEKECPPTSNFCQHGDSDSNPNPDSQVRQVMLAPLNVECCCCKILRSFGKFSVLIKIHMYHSALPLCNN